MNYLKIDTCDMINGEGVRVSLWVSGCKHKCQNCHNPHSHSPTAGVLFDDDAINLIMSTLSNNWCEGLTITGGDPLHPDNEYEVLKLCKLVKSAFPNKSIWMWTGSVYESITMFKKWGYDILRNIDVLVDGRYIHDLDEKGQTFKYRGSSNQRVIDVKESLVKNSVVNYLE